MPTENLWTVFGSEALSDPDPYKFLQRLLDVTKNDHVNSVMYHVPYDLTNFVQPDLGGFGRFMILPTGERVFARVRSFFGCNEVFDRALLPIEYGETREVSVVVTSLEDHFRKGVIKVLVASWLSFSTPDVECGDIPAFACAPSQAGHGISVGPMMLLDRFAGKNKRAVSIAGYETLWAGSTTIVEQWDALNNCPSKTSIFSGVSNHQLCEWVAGVEKRSKANLSIIWECSSTMFEQVARKCISKVQPTLMYRRAHPVDGKPREVLSSFTQCMYVSNFFLEHATLGGIIDLLARDVFKGVDCAVFCMPTMLPLYVTACVLLAAFPEVARLPNTGKSHAEDKANAAPLIETFRSLTSGYDLSSRQRTTAIEAVLAVACDGIGSTIKKTVRTTADGKLRSVYTKQTPGEQPTVESTDVPSATESMRRQGAALVQELFSHYPSELETFYIDDMRAKLGKETLEATRNVVSNPVARSCVVEARRRGGSTGSTAHTGPRAIRHATRNSMQRVVLEMMLEINQFCTDGTFRTIRYSPENTSAEEAVNGPHSGLRRNASACRVMHAELLASFQNGMAELINDGIPRTMPIRPCTEVRCGECGSGFDPLTLLYRDALACCEECGVTFCMKCYKRKATEVRDATIGKPATASILEEHKRTLLCQRCR